MTFGAWVNPDLSQDLSLLTPDTQSAVKKLMDAAAAQGLQLQVRSTLRTCAQQHEQYMIGRGAGDDRAIVTGADGCRSWHVLGRAVDFNVNGGGSYADLGALAESLGFTWGGRFTNLGPNGDPGHVEWHPGMTIEQACPDPSACTDMQPSSPEADDMTSQVAALAAGLLLGFAVTHFVLGD